MADERASSEVESLRVTREEACEVLNRQAEAIHDIERKAIHTFRLNVLLLGAVLTVGSLLAGNGTTPEIGRVVNDLVIAGVGASGASIVMSILAYAGSGYQTGIGASDVRTVLRRQVTEDEWLTALLYSYTVWMKRNETANRRDGIVLYIGQFFLFLSVSYYATGVVYGLYIPPDSQLPIRILALVYGLGTGLLLLSSNRLTGPASRLVED